MTPGDVTSCDWGICNEPLREKEPTLCIAGHVQKGARMSAISTAQAVIQRVDHGEGEPLNLWQATEAVQHPLTGLKREDLVVVVAYLACQVVGYAHRADADAGLALAQIRTAVQNYDRRHGAA